MGVSGILAEIRAAFLRSRIASYDVQKERFGFDHVTFSNLTSGKSGQIAKYS